MSPDNSASERTPLINGAGAAHAHRSNPHHHSGSRTLHFLTNSKYTPGTDSDNFAVRAAAYTWHVTKVTLLSSTLLNYYTAPQTRHKFAEFQRCLKKRAQRANAIAKHHRLCQLPPHHRPHWHHCRLHGLGLHRRLHHQLLRHHPPRRRPVLCHRGNLPAPGRGHGRLVECHLWQCRRVDCTFCLFSFSWLLPGSLGPSARYTRQQTNTASSLTG